MRVVSVLLESGTSQAMGGICGAGQGMAADLNTSFEILAPASLPSEMREELASFSDALMLVEGLDCLEHTPESILTVLTEIFRDDSPQAIIFGNGVYAQEIAPRLALRLGGSCAGDVQSLSASSNGVLVSRPVYGGKAMASLSLEKTPAVVWVRSAAIAKAVPRAAKGTQTTLEKSPPVDEGTTLIERHVESNAGVRLEDAQVIVSGGRGLGSAAPFERLKALAEPMGAEMAASRAACDLGWVPHSWQVGQTGKKVAPDLYLAVAMSGSSQHLMGIADAKNIVAINTDPEAPIFKHSRFGIVEDYDKVVDLLKDKLVDKLK